MGSSSNLLPIAWLDSDLKLPHIPKFAPSKPNRRDKSAARISRLLHLAPTLMKKKSLADKPPAEDGLPTEDSHTPPSIPNLKGTMNPALVFGLQVSTLISRDRAMLQRKYTPALEAESPDSTMVQRKRALEHAKLVTEQMGQIGQRSIKRRCINRTGKRSDEEVEIFRFTDLPSEIRDMIYTFYFTNSSGEKPSLMWAFKINGVKIKGDFYNSAEKVYYTVNNWTFNIRDCLKNSILGNMDQFHVEMIRKMTIEIPKEIQACTKLSSVLSRAVNINDLTLAAKSDTGIRRAMHELMPGFKYLQRITISILRPKESRQSLRRGNTRTKYFKLFRPVREMLDKLLDQEGILIRETDRVQEWRWEVDDLKKPFKTTCPKKHIKFD